MILLTLFRFAFASAPRLHRLTSHHIVTRRPVLQKVRRRALNALRLLVNLRFQVLFHSPPGVLFTFPSRYFSLSVTWSYLALRDGPRVFRQDFSCPDVLRISARLISSFTYGIFTLSDLPFQIVRLDSFLTSRGSLPLKYFYLRFGLLRFRSPLLSESLLFSFPSGT